MEKQNNQSLLRIQTEDGFEIQYDLVEALGAGRFETVDLKKIENLTKIRDLNQKIEELELIKEELNQEIDNFTNHSDKIDYAVAVGSGILAGIFDIFVVGELDIEKALNGVHDANGNVVEKGVHQNVEKFIKSFARFASKWIPETGEINEEKAAKGGLKYFIGRLEEWFPVEQDSAYSGEKIGSCGINHHLTDLAHHPTVLGLFAAIMVQILRVAWFSDKKGGWHILCVDDDLETFIKNFAKNVLPIVISGILLWLVNIAKEENIDKLERLPKPILKIVKMLASAPVALQMLTIFVNWFGHLMSDIAGSKQTAGGGAGIPGFFLSALEEISRAPEFKSSGLPGVVHSLYTSEKNIFGRKIDFRTELAFLSELKRQSIPVIMNELIVRTFYFVRMLIQEIGEVKNPRNVEWNKINWVNVLPWGNRTINRMLTISSGTFMAVDMADAAIRAASETGGIPPAFFTKFLLRVNFIGVGRFVIAMGSDLNMEYKRRNLIGDRMKVSSQLMLMSNSKIMYYESNMWISAEEAGKSLYNTYKLLQGFCIRYTDLYNEYDGNRKKTEKELEYMRSTRNRYKEYLNS